jgi:hypothetical protein
MVIDNVISGRTYIDHYDDHYPSLPRKGRIDNGLLELGNR